MNKPGDDMKTEHLMNDLASLGYDVEIQVWPKTKKLQPQIQVTVREARGELEDRRSYRKACMVRSPEKIREAIQVLYMDILNIKKGED